MNDIKAGSPAAEYSDKTGLLILIKAERCCCMKVFSHQLADCISAGLSVSGVFYKYVSFI